MATAGLERCTTARAPQGEVDEARASDLRGQAEGQLAIPVSLGFLLIVPLQGHALWRSFTFPHSIANRQQAGASQRAETVRQANTRTSSAEDLQRRLLALRRPDRRIDLDLSSCPALPLTAPKQQLLSWLDRAEGPFKARFAPIDPARTHRITRESRRVLVASIGFAIGFAACAQRRNTLVPIPVE